MIEILSYERVNKNKIIGYVDIKITSWGLILRRIAHLQSGDRKWFNMPSYVIEQSDGTKKYVPYFQLALEVHSGQLFEKIDELLKEFCVKNKIEEIKPLDFSADIPF